MPVDLSIANSVIRAFALGRQELERKQAREATEAFRQQQLEQQQKQFEDNLAYQRDVNDALAKHRENQLKLQELGFRINLPNILGPQIQKGYIPSTPVTTDETIQHGLDYPDTIPTTLMQRAQLTPELAELMGQLTMTVPSLAMQDRQAAEAAGMQARAVAEAQAPSQIAIQREKAAMDFGMWQLKETDRQNFTLKLEKLRDKYKKEQLRTPRPSPPLSPTAEANRRENIAALDAGTIAALVGRRPLGTSAQDDKIRSKIAKFPELKEIPPDFVKDLNSGYMAQISDIRGIINEIREIVSRDDSAMSNFGKSSILGTELSAIYNRLKSRGPILANQMGHKGRLSDKDIESSLASIFVPTYSGSQVYKALDNFEDLIRLRTWVGSLGGLPTKQKLAILKDRGLDSEDFAPLVEVPYQGRKVKTSSISFNPDTNIWEEYNLKTGQFEDVISADELKNLFGGK